MSLFQVRIFSICAIQGAQNLEIPPHLVRLLLSPPVGVVNSLDNDLLQWLPAILTGPFLQQSNRLGLISREFQVESLRVS